MSKEKAQDLTSRVVVIDGKGFTISEVRKSFAELELLTTGGSMKVVDVLLHTKSPLTRQQISDKASLSLGYTIDVLNKLVKYDYVLAFHIGKRRLLYYALTEEGYEVLAKKNFESET